MYDPGVLRDYFHFRLLCAGEELLKEILVKKFGDVPPDIAAEFRYCHELDLLEDWVMAANEAESLDGFRYHVFHVAPASIN